MVIRFILSCLLLPFCLFSGEFTASVNRTEVDLTGGFTLTLTLKDASAKTSPAIESILRSFQINSQQQTSNSSFINGKVNSTTSWKFLLMPRDEGEITIPSVSIDTSDGTLISQPITIHVVKGVTQNHNHKENAEEVNVTTSFSKKNPFKNEPVFYTLRLSSRQPLVNLQTQKFQIDDAIVELMNEPQIYESMDSGVRVGIIEFNYLITPLKPGPLKIPSQAIQGGIPVKRKSSSFRSFFDDEFDPFAFIQGFDQLKPFVVTTEESVIDVQPAVAGIAPWLPARSVTIKEIWDDSQQIRAGEFFTRSFVIEADGVNSSQLPSLNEMQAGKTQAKVYADKPELFDEVKNGKLFSSRKEQYTIIPSRPGTLVLPEISIVWWDVVKNEMAVAVVPARALEVSPAAAENTSVPFDVPTKNENETIASSDQTQINHWLYLLIGALVILVLLAFIWGILLQKKMNRLLHPHISMQKIAMPKKIEKNEKKKDKNEKLNDLNPT